MEYTWRSVRWESADAMLDAFSYRSQDYSLFVALEADMWVLTPENEVAGGQIATFRDQYGNTTALEAMAARHETSSWSEVPWEEYDIVTGFEPIVPDHVVKQHPQILWCYKSIGHCWPAHRRWAQRPDGAYDLFLDHYTGGWWSCKLPASIHFPHMINIETMRLAVVRQQKPAVFLDHTMVPRPGHGCSQQYYDDVMASYEETTGLSIAHALGLGSGTQQHANVCRGQIRPTREYLQRVAECKYFAVVREGAAIGQAVAEAAALGCIVISNSTCRYAQKVCHPCCLTPTTGRQEDKDAGMKAIRKIEADPSLQEEILAHQDERLRCYFWNEPMAILEEALEVKRR